MGLNGGCGGRVGAIKGVEGRGAFCSGHGAIGIMGCS